MSQHEPLTKVIFRVWKGEPRSVIALFPSEAATVGNPYHCSSYEHVGQHGAADPYLVMQNTRPARPGEYRDLARELSRRGYRLRPVRRMNRRDLEARRAQLND